MKPHVSPSSVLPAEVADITRHRTILATDLAPAPARRPLWRPARGGADPAPPASEGLSEEGYASPMAYWLSAPSLPTALSPGGLTITFVTQGVDDGPAPASLARSPDGSYTRPVQSLRVKGPNAGDGDVQLTIGPGGARVTSTPAAWRALAEPVLLAVCQYWRFAAIDAEIARLTELAQGDLDHATMPGLGTLRAHRRAVRAARDVRALMLDLPFFEGPLSDPLPYCTTERSATIYESVSEKLHLEAWSELIDDRAEAIEDAYEALTEKLFEFKNFAWEAALEVLIVVILLAELSLGLYEAFG